MKIKMLRVLVLALLVGMMVNLFPVSAFAAEEDVLAQIETSMTEAKEFPDSGKNHGPGLSAYPEIPRTAPPQATQYQSLPKTADNGAPLLLFALLSLSLFGMYATVMIGTRDIEE